LRRGLPFGPHLYFRRRVGSFELPAIATNNTIGLHKALDPDLDKADALVSRIRKGPWAIGIAAPRFAYTRKLAQLQAKDAKREFDRRFGVVHRRCLLRVQLCQG
jgi:hypothetical protein